jgi:hypothetical protein
METLKLSIVTPNGMIFDGDVKSVTLPGKEGEFGVLPHHASLLSALTVGVIEIEKKDSTKEAGAKRALVLDMSVASHCELLNSAVEKLNPYLEQFVTENFESGVISNVSASANFFPSLLTSEQTIIPSLERIFCVFLV